MHFVAAIDIGTTYTEYAFSARKNPNSIYICDWRRSVRLYQPPHKAPTSVLLNQSKEFLAFGHDAENKYMANREISDSDDSDDEDSGEEKAVLYYFRRFNLALLNKICNTIILMSCGICSQSLGKRKKNHIRTNCSLLVKLLLWVMS